MEELVRMALYLTKLVNGQVQKLRVSPTKAIYRGYWAVIVGGFAGTSVTCNGVTKFIGSSERVAFNIITPGTYTFTATRQGTTITKEVVLNDDTQEYIINLSMFIGMQQLEYIESTGTQYIDTGFKPNNNTRVVAEFMATSYITDKPTWQSTLFSVRTSGNLEAYGEFVCSQDSPNGLRSDYGTNTNEQSCGTNLLLKKIKVDKNKNVTTYTYNGTVLSTIITSVQTFSTPYSLWLFRINDAGRPLGASNIRLYSCKIYDNDTLVRDFVPVLDYAGIPCMYDQVEGKLYYNKGTGEFVAGPEKQ